MHQHTTMADPQPRTTKTTCTDAAVSVKTPVMLTSSGSSNTMPPPLDAPDDQLSLPRNVYVRNLPETVTESDIPDIFGKFGAIESSKLMVDIKTGASRGFGFILFKDHAAAAAAVAELEGATVNGWRLSVRFADPKTRRPGEASDCVFLRNLPAELTESHVRALCASDGEPVSVTLRRDERHGQRGSGAAASGSDEGTSLVAHVSMPSVESAAALVRRLNHSAQFAHNVGAPLQAKVVDASKKLRTGGSSRPARNADVSSSEARQPATPPAPVQLQPAYQPGVGAPQPQFAFAVPPHERWHGPVRVGQFELNPPPEAGGSAPPPPQGFYSGPVPGALFVPQFAPHPQAVVASGGVPQLPLYPTPGASGQAMPFAHASGAPPFHAGPHHQQQHSHLLPVALAHHHPQQQHQYQMSQHHLHQQHHHHDRQEQHPPAPVAFLPSYYRPADQAAAPAGPIQPLRPAHVTPPPPGNAPPRYHHHHHQLHQQPPTPSLPQQQPQVQRQRL